MLEVRGVTKSFGDFQAIKEAYLEVSEGELVAVIGPNGAGKTTLFNLISGQLKPDSGTITFRGRQIGGLPPHEICRQGISRSFQIVNIFPRLTVFENVQVAVISHRRKSRVLHRVADGFLAEETERILESVGLLEKSRFVAGSLSHGDQKVLEIAIALGNDPSLLILDEPTAGMSPEETVNTMELVRRLSTQKGITILFCEHDMDVVFNVATSIMVMHQGRTIVQGAPEEVRGNKLVEEAYLGA